MNNTTYLITSYVNSQKNYLDSKPLVINDSKYTCINFTFNGLDIEVCVYNSSFIKLKVDDMPYAICDGIKTFRDEIDKLHTLRYQ